MNLDEAAVSRLSCLVVALVFVAGLLHLGVRLREVQVEGAADYAYASARQSVRRVQVGGARGRILDRNGAVLADNRVSLSIVCDAAQFQRRTWEATVEAIGEAVARVGEAIGRRPGIGLREIRRHVRQTLPMPLVVWRDVDEDVLARFSERARRFPGFSVEETDERVYPQGRLAAHLLGYVGRDRGKSVAGDEKFSFFATELAGRAGAETFFDSYLRGVPGERRLLVDARGFTLRSWTVVEPQKGPDLRLTIDLALQREAERQLEGLKGACVAIDPDNGDVLALASAPGFDPNDFVPTLPQTTYERFAKDPDVPLLNRATGGSYAPGSTFKPVTALAALGAGVPASETHLCAGEFRLGQMRLRCSNRWGHGELDLCHALMKSCNPYFCELGMRVGTNALVRAARAFGLGSRTGIDFGVDEAGVVPDGAWKLAHHREKWFAGDLAQMSIGQGMLLVSPLQMARLAGAIGTDFLVTPRLALGAPVERTRLPFAPEHLRTVRKGMRMVVNGDGMSQGTGWRGAEDVAAEVIGKTGTAEVGKGETRRNNTWFIAYAYAHGRALAVAMVIENGDSGGGTTAPRVAAVLRARFGSNTHLK